MPIKGLTDRASIKAQFPRLGKLRKGGVKTAKKPGLELDYWRFTSDSADVKEDFDNVYGDKPRVINVYLPYARLEDNFPSWKEKWVSGGLEHRCDGETCQIHRKNGGYSREPIPCPGGCKEVGRLSVIIPELFDAGHIGTVTMETHGNHDLRAITSTLKAVEDAMERDGRAPNLIGIPFSLARVQEEVSSPGWGENKGKRVRVKKWNVKLRPHRDVARELLMSAEPVKALPAPVDYETGEIIEEQEAPGNERASTPPIPQADGTTKPAPEAKPRIVVNAKTVDAAMRAETESGNKMHTGNRLTWAKVATNADGHYSAELAQHAAVLMEAPELVKDWMERNAEGIIISY